MNQFLIKIILKRQAHACAFMQVVINTIHVTAVANGAWAAQAIIGYDNWNFLIYGIFPDEFYAIQNKILFFGNGLNRVLNREIFVNYYQEIFCGS